MALTGPDGEELSHLGRRLGDPLVTRRAPEETGMVRPVPPHRGRWVGPREEQKPWMAQVADAAQAKAAKDASETVPSGIRNAAPQTIATLVDGRRREAAVALRLLIEAAELTPEQRQTLTQAMFVVAQL